MKKSKPKISKARSSRRVSDPKTGRKSDEAFVEARTTKSKNSAVYLGEQSSTRIEQLSPPAPQFAEKTIQHVSPVEVAEYDPSASASKPKRDIKEPQTNDKKQRITKVISEKLVTEWRAKYTFGNFEIWIFELIPEIVGARSAIVLDGSQKRNEPVTLDASPKIAAITKKGERFNFVIQKPDGSLVFERCPSRLKAFNFRQSAVADFDNLDRSLLKACIKKILAKYTVNFDAHEMAKIFGDDLGDALTPLHLEELCNVSGVSGLSRDELIEFQDVAIKKMNASSLTRIPEKLHPAFSTFFVNSGQKAIFLIDLGVNGRAPIEKIEFLTPIDHRFLRQFCRKDKHWAHHLVMVSEEIDDALTFGVLLEFLQAHFPLEVLPYFVEAYLADNDFVPSSEESFFIALCWSLIGDYEKATAWFSNHQRVYFPPNGRRQLVSQLLVEATSTQKLYQTEKFESVFGKLPKISVIVPVFNAETYVDQTLRSLFSQDYDNLEVIFVDGGSTDRTVEIAKQYEKKIKKLISEPDNGQSQAINKGLRHATGDLVTWLNGDDMLFPNALKVIGMNYLLSEADLIAGGVIEFQEELEAPRLYNRALQQGAKLTKEDLGDIYGRWFKGHFFYQPEVFFKRSTLMSLEGPVDESLYFTMDYDLWLRLAEKRATIHTVDHPICLFRKHEGQKTNDLFSCTEEQFQVLRKTTGPSPVDTRKLAKLRAGKVAPNFQFSFYSSRSEKIFYPEYQTEIFAEDKSFVPITDIENTSWAKISHLLLAVHLQDDLATIERIREANPKLIIIGWFWDNHHHFEANFEVATQLDAFFVGHSLHADYLKFSQTPYLGHLPLCMTQFPQNAVPAPLPVEQRSDLLHSGHVYYPFARERQGVLEWLRDESGLDQAMMRFMHDGKFGDFTTMTVEEKFFDWSQCKASLQVPLNNDLSQRMFDCLLAGTIPLVPIQCKDYWALFSKKEIKDLGLVEYDINAPASIIAAFNEAVSMFDKLGDRGISLRHQWAKSHFLENRLTFAIGEVVKKTAKIKRQGY